MNALYALSYGAVGPWRGNALSKDQQPRSKAITAAATIIIITPVNKLNGSTTAVLHQQAGSTTLAIIGSGRVKNNYRWRRNRPSAGIVIGKASLASLATRWTTDFTVILP
jgi:hypothetical protein